MTNSKRKELANTDFESWARESFEIAAKFAYRNGGRIGSTKGGAMDCAIVAAAPVLPTGYVVRASRIADRRMILAGYRLANLLTRVARQEENARKLFKQQAVAAILMLSVCSRYALGDKLKNSGELRGIR